MKEDKNPDKLFYRQLYNAIDDLVKDFENSEFRGCNGETIRRIAHMRFIELQQKLLRFAESKGWLNTLEHRLCDMYLAEKMADGCPKCG